MIEIIQILLLVGVIYLILRGQRSLAPKTKERSLILDSCVLIDGRILDVATAGFTSRSLIIPRFVVNELQLLADGNDSKKRERARNGLDLVKTLQGDPDLQVDISDKDFANLKTTDDKLIALAKAMSADLCTTDYNLNKVAAIEKVHVLNINELSNAVRVVALPGETKQVTIVQKGSSKDQGVGYLDDGTMVVVAGGAKLVGQNIKVEIDRLIQTDAGKMLFGSILRQKKSANTQQQTRQRQS